MLLVSCILNKLQRNQRHLQTKFKLIKLFVHQINYSFGLMTQTRKRLVIDKSRRKQHFTDQQPYKFSSRTENKIDLVIKQKENYRKKYEQTLSKCSILENIMEEKGFTSLIPKGIISQLSSTEKRIREIQEILQDRNDIRMQKLQRQIVIFLKDLGLDTDCRIFSKLRSEIEIISFLLELFSTRFQEVTRQNDELLEFISSIKENQNSIDKYYESQIQELRVQIDVVYRRYCEQEAEVLQLKTILDKTDRMRFSEKDDNGFEFAQSLYPGDELLTDETELPTKFAEPQMQTSEAQGVAEQYRIKLMDFNLKIQILEKEVNRLQREQVRWKQSYSTIETQHPRDTQYQMDISSTNAKGY